MAYLSSRSPLGGITDVLTAVKNVTEDPCLFQVAARTSRLTEVLHAAQQPGRPTTPAPAVKGIGLCSAVRPLEIATYVAERPWLVPVGAVTIVGLLVGIGYALGRSR